MKISWYKTGNAWWTDIENVGRYTVQLIPSAPKGKKTRVCLNDKPIYVGALGVEPAKRMTEQRIRTAIEIANVQEPATRLKDRITKLLSDPDVRRALERKPASGEKDMATAANELAAAAIAAEKALGENLQWLTDKFDLAIRQGDIDTKGRLEQLNAAWIGLAKATKGWE